MTSSDSDLLTDALLHRLPEGWSASEPDAGDAPEITALLRRHEERGRGWASAGEDDVLIEVSARGYITRENVILRDAEGELRGWASAHDRAAGRMHNHLARAANALAAEMGAPSLFPLRR